MATTKAKPLQAFPDPTKPKTFYLARVRKHRLADELVRGVGWETNGVTRGCAVGCTVECSDHSVYPELLGVPVELAYVEDYLFENLPKDHLLFPEEFLRAITPGADLSRVYGQWCVRLLSRCIGFVGEGSERWRVECRESVTIVRDGFAADQLYHQSEAARAAGNVAMATGNAAWAAFDAAWAAGNAARAGGNAARAAHNAATAADAAARAGGNAEIETQAADLLQLLRAATTTAEPPRSCPVCGGQGQLCADCGLALTDCRCGSDDGETVDCGRCNGTGRE